MGWLPVHLHHVVRVCADRHQWDSLILRTEKLGLWDVKALVESDDDKAILSELAA